MSNLKTWVVQIDFDDMSTKSMLAEAIDEEFEDIEADIFMSWEHEKGLDTAGEK